tara:strand:+ start:636 stop:1964 length:1329 start_codon:yes stop_codon:yes gene_type:complete
MSFPQLTPSSNTSAVVLPSTGSSADVKAALPFAVYDTSDFKEGAAAQVAYTFKKLGGDVLDIELKADNVYAAYEEACLEYSYQINIHQAKNVLSDLLGMATGTFNHLGEHQTGSNQDSVSGSLVNLKYPRYKFTYAQRVADGLAEEAGVGGNLIEYSASFNVVAGQQDYDLQTIISGNSIDINAETKSAVPYGTGSIEKSPGTLTPNQQDRMNRKFKIRRVYYKTPASVWRFYGYYGGLNVVGNLNYYGQFADDTTFEIIPSWHNKLQAMAYEDHLYTRLSHYSYEIENNKLRLYPIPQAEIPATFWVTFTMHRDAWEEDSDRKSGVSGINNMNTLPFPNVPYKNINSIGKQWIRRYALALTKEILGQVRGKFASLPIPGESVTLNASDLLSQAREEQTSLKEELKTVLDQMTYRALAEQDAAMVGAIDTVYQEIPLPIFQG